MTQALKPCPFCGSLDLPVLPGHVRCLRCQAQGPLSDNQRDAWNTRTSTAEWERDVARADLRDLQKWLNVIAIELNTDPDKTMREITDPRDIVIRILDHITQLKAAATDKE